jgi:hypothetical protein
MRRKKQKSRAQRALAVRPVAPAKSPQASRRRVYIPRKAATMVRRIFRANDPVDIAEKLLNGEGDATAGKLYLQLFEYLYGKPASPMDTRGYVNDRAPFDFITHIPQPEYPVQAPTTTASSSTSLPATAAPVCRQLSETTEGNEHD